MLNLPNLETAAYARRVSGRRDLDEALTDAFKGKTFITLGRTAALVDGAYVPVPTGTEVTLREATNAGANGIQITAATPEGHIVCTGWDRIGGAARHMF